MEIRGSAITSVTVRVVIGVLLSFFSVGGTLFTVLGLIYGIKAYLNKDPKGLACLLVSAAGFVFSMFLAIYRIVMLRYSF